MAKALNMKMNLQFDTAQARKALYSLYQQVDSLSSAQALKRNSSLGLTSQILEATKAASQLKYTLQDSVNPLNGSLNLANFTDSLNKSKASLADYKTQLSALGATGNQAFNSLARSIVQAETPLTRSSKLASQMWTVFGNTMRWQATSMAIHGVLNTVSSAVGYVKSLDKSLNNIQIVTGQSTEQMERFAKQANMAAKSLNTTTNEYAKASLIYYQQGLSNKQVQERTETTIKLANVSGQTAKTVSDQMTAIWNNFYNGSKSLEYYADVITALGATTASSSEEIAKGLSKFSSIAQTTGLSYEYATSALSTVVAATRQSADSVGTSFKTLFSRLQGLSLGGTLEDGTTLNKYSNALLTVGVNIKQANGELKSMDSILDEIGKKWQDLREDEKIALSQTVGGVRNYTSLMALMENWDDFQTNLQTARMAEGTLQAQADIYADSWAAASKHVQAAAETIYSNLLDDKVFKGLTNGFGTVLDIVGSVTDSLGGFGGTMMGLLTLGTRVFAPQMANAFSNIGNTITGFVQGREYVEQVKLDAQRALREDVNFSQHSQVNAIQKGFNQDFLDRQAKYDEAISKGKIAPYLQPTYQSLFNSVDTMADAAVASAQTYFDNQIAINQSNLGGYQTLNYLANQNNDYYKNASYDGNVGSYVQQQLKNYQTQYNRESNAQMLQGYLGVPDVGTENNQKVFDIQMAKNLGQHLTTMVEGYKALGQGDYFNTLPKDLQKQFRDFYTGFQDAVKGTPYIEAKESGIGEYSRKDFKGGLYYKDDDGTMHSLKYKDYAKDSLNPKYNTLYKNNSTKFEEQVNTKLQTLIGNTGDSGNVLKNLSEGINNYLQDAEASGEGTGAIKQATIDAVTQGMSQNDKEIATQVINKMFENKELSVNTLNKAAQETGATKDLTKQIAASLGLQLEGKPTLTGGQAATTIASGLAGVTTALMAGYKAVKVFGDENATAEQKVSSLATTLMTMPMAVSGVSNLIGSWGKEIGDTGVTIGKATLATTAAIAAIVGAVELGQAIDRRSDENTTKRYSTMIAAASQISSDAKNAYDTIQTAHNAYSQGMQELNYMQQGSIEYYDKLNEMNTLASSTIEDNDLVYGRDWTIGKNNQTIINPGTWDRLEEEKKSSYQRSVTDQQILTFAKQIQQAQKDINQYHSITTIDELSTKSSDPYTLSWMYDEIGANSNNMVGNQALATQGQARRNVAIGGLAQVIANEMYQNGEISNIDFIAASMAQQMQGEIGDILNRINSGNVGDWAQVFGQDHMTSSQLYKKFQELGYIDEGELPATKEEINAKNTAAYIKYMTQNGTYITGETIGEGFRTFAELNEIMGKDSAGLSRRFQYLTAEEIKQELEKNYVAGTYTLTDASGVQRQVLDQYGEKVDEGIILTELGKMIADSAYGALKQGIDDFGTAIKTNIDSNFNFANEDFQKAIKEMSLSDFQQATTYLTAAGAYGKKTSEFVLNKVLYGGDRTNTFKQLSKINWDGSVTGLLDIDKAIRNADNDLAKDFFKEALNAAIEDIGGEKGIFDSLYYSSNFSKALEVLNEQFETAGQITAQNISDIAKKSEELSSVLKLSNSEFTNLNLNAGGLAAALNAINSGTITANQMTSNLLSSLSTAESLPSIQAQAFSDLDNLNLGRSGGEFTSYFQAAGKAWYQSSLAKMTFDEPLRNAVEKFMPSSMRDAYYEAIKNGNGKDYGTIIKELPQEMRDFFDLMAGRKGKGGGSMPDIIKFYGGIMDNTKITADMAKKLGMSEKEIAQWTDKSLSDWMKEVGLGFGSNGDINLYSLNDLDQGLTSEGLVERISQAFEAMGFSSENAKQFGEIFTAVVGDSSAGYTLKQNDANAAMRQLQGYNIDKYGNIITNEGTTVTIDGKGNLATVDSEGHFHPINEDLSISRNLQTFSNGDVGGNAHFISEAALKTAFNTYGQYLGYGSDEWDRFKKDATQGFDGQSGTGDDSRILFNNSEFWQNGEINNKNILAQQMAAEGKELAENISDEEIQEMTRGLLEDYGVIDENGVLDTSRLTDFVVATGGTESSAQTWLSNMGNLGEGITTRTVLQDKFGNTHTLDLRDGETYEQYQGRIQDVKNNMDSDWFWDNSTGTYIHDPGGYLRDQYYNAPGAGADSYWAHKNADRKSGAVPAEEKIAALGEAQAADNAAKEAAKDEVNRLQQEYQDWYDSLTPEQQRTVDLTKSGDPYTASWANPDFDPEILNEAMDRQRAIQEQRDIASGKSASSHANQDAWQEQYGNVPDTTVTDTDRASMAKAYSTAINNRIESGIGVTSQQKAISDLYAQYESVKGTNPEFASKILNKIDELISNSEDLVDNTGNLVDLETTGQENAADEEYEMDQESGNVKGKKGNKDIELPGQEQQEGENSEGGDSGGGNDQPANGEDYSGSGNGGSGSRDEMKGLPDNVKDQLANMGYGGDGKTPPNHVQTDDGDFSWDEASGSYVPDNVDLTTAGNKASGQNNNLLPHFAAGTGTIAVTGELGPELHVKPNGDMDLLGKHGREYVWVEPNDKIYTAAQTASILGSKKIREMISAHAAGINNFIPGFAKGDPIASTDYSGSSSGGGGSGGGSISFGGGGGDAAEAELTAENHRFDANWLKYRDILERYYTILQQLEDLANELQRFATLADRAWGKTRIDNIEKTIEVQEQQVTAQRAYLSEINTYLQADKKTMTEGIKEFVDQWNEMYPNRQLGFEGAQFDQNGVLTNYRQIVESMLDAYNMDVSGYGYASGMYSVGAAGSPGQGLFSALAGAIANGIISGLNKNGEIIAEKRVTEPFFASGQNNKDASTTTVIESVATKTQANPQQTILEEKIKDIQFYTQTLNLYQQQLTVLEQMQQQLFDTRLQAIQVEVEYKVALKNNALTLLDYSLAKVRDDAYMAAEAVSLIGQEQDINIGILEDYEQELKDILNLNLNGEQFFGSNDLVLTPTMNMSQIEKDLQSLSELHEKFWDEDSQHYLDKYKENIKTGEIFFDEETKNKVTNNNSMFKDYLAWDEADEGAFYTNSELIGDGSSRGEDSPDKDIIEHNIDEYNALVARLYEKYYANYSQYLPDPEEFLQFRNSKERLQRLEEIAEAIEKTNTTGRGSSSGSSGRGSSAAGGPTLSDDGRSGSSVIMSSIGGGRSLSGTSGSEIATELPDYLYLIDNVDEALERLEFLSNLLNKNSIKVDIDKFTGEFKNIPEVTEQLQSVFDELIVDFPKLGKEIEDVDKKLIHFDDTTQRWILDINSYQDANKILEKINATNRQKLTDARFEQFKEDPVAFWNWATDLSENFDFTNFTANQIQMLNQLSTTYLSNISNLKNSVLTQIDYLGNSVKAYAKDMDTAFNKFDHYKNLYADWQNIIDLTGRSTTKLSHDLILQLNSNVVDNSINKLASAKNQFDSINHMQELAQARYLQAQAELDAFEGDKEQRYWLQNIVDEYKLNLDKINKETEEAEDAYMKSWEDALQGLTTAFQQAVKDAAAGFEESFSPIYNTLDALSGAIERQRALRDLYMSPYEQAHGLSQMARDIKQSILDTDNINSKKELKKLLNEINDAQEDGVELSSYDLDVMQKKYDLELARQALEDAKNAKSLVRLSRDNNGNWGYVYTANEDDIDEAEQRYEDAILAMEQTNQNYIDSLQDQLLQVWGNAEAQIAALNPSDFATEEEFKKRVAEITNLANEQIRFIQEQMKNALNNNNYLLDNVSGNAANIMKDLTTSFDNTIIASLVGTDNIDDLAEQSIGNVLDLGEKANNAYSIFQTRNAEVWATAGADISNASETINSAIENIGDLSLNNVNEMSKVVDRATVAFNNLNNVLDIQADKIYTIVNNYEQLVKSMTQLIERSGEYIKQNTMVIDSTITRWEQLDNIYNALMTDGSVWLKYLDEDGKWTQKFLEVGTEDTLEWLNEQRYKLVNTLLHSEADEFIFKSQSELDGYYNAIKELVETRGLIKLDIKGDLLDKILNITEEDLGEDGDARLLELKNYFDNVDKLIDEKGNRLDNGDTVGLLTLDAVHNEAFVKEILELLRSLLEIKEEEVSEGGWDVSDDSGGDWYQQVMATNGSPTSTHNDFSYGNKQSDEAQQFHHMFGDTGMYTGRWQSMDTGGYSGNWYTGEWPNGSVRRNGRLAWLHQKELVLNAHDTENFLDAMEIVRQLDNLTNWMANGLGVLAPTNVEPDEEILQQEVNIHAEFPNVTDHHEIEDALNNLVNRASQYVNRR